MRSGVAHLHLPLTQLHTSILILPTLPPSFQHTSLAPDAPPVTGLLTFITPLALLFPFAAAVRGAVGRNPTLLLVCPRLMDSLPADATVPLDDDVEAERA